MAGPITAKQERHTQAVRTMVERDRRTDARAPVINHRTGFKMGTTAAPKPAPKSSAGTVKATNRTTPTTTTKALKEAAANKPKAPPKATTRPVTPANTRSASARGTAPPGRTGGTKAKATGVNKATQAVRDARAVSKAAGERYTRKAGGEKSVNAATQARRIERATVRGQTRKGLGVVAPPAPTRASQRGATDWQKAHADWMTNPSGIDPAFDINNTDAQYVADANMAYRDVDGSLGWQQIAKNLRQQIVDAMADGKTQVVLPDGEKWAAHQSTLDQIDRNLAEKNA